MITPPDIDILVAVATYFTLTRAQVGRLVFPNDRDGRATRRHLQRLLSLGYLNRARMEVVNPAYGAPAPVYFPSRDGCAFLAEHFGDDRYRACCTQTPNWQHLLHWCAVADVHIALDRAAAHADGVTVADWLGEWTVANPDEQSPEKRFRLYTRLSEKLVCVPDAGFALRNRTGAERAFYLELDRHTTMNAERVAAQKCGGYAGLAAVRGHLRHFPASNPERFTVLMPAPSPQRRDALKKAVAKRPGAELWRFASLTELTPETFLSAPIWHPCAGEPSAILRA